MYFNKELIFLDLQAETKAMAIEQLVAKAGEHQLINNNGQFIRSVLAREELISTHLGNAMAVPHGRCSTVQRGFLVIGRFNAPMLWDSEGEVAQTLFLIGAPNDEADEHLDILGWLSSRLVKDNMIRDLNEAATTEQFWQAINRA